MSLVDRDTFQTLLATYRSSEVVKMDAKTLLDEASSSRPASTKPKAVPVDAKPRTLPSVAEYRGTSALANVKPSKNYSNDPRHTSIAFGEMKIEATPHRQPNDVTQHQVNALLTGSGNLFDKHLCKTNKGWKPGRFA